MRIIDRKSAADGVVLWEEDDDEAGWKCRKHASQPRYGVCPCCLRDRLLRLCPDCAKVRPCGCFPSSSSSSSFSSLSSADLARSGAAGAGGTGVGAVGSVSRLIECEPAFQRSRSLGFPILRPVADSADGEALPPRPRGRRTWALFWPLWRTASVKEPAAAALTANVKLSKSRSVGVASLPGTGGGDGRGKGWGWHFPSPIKAFRHRKSTKVVQDLSPLHRG